MYVNQALSPVLVALRKHRSLMPQRRRITIRRQSGGGHLHLPRSCRRGPRSRHDLLIRSSMSGHPDPFRSVRDLGRVPARCWCPSGIPEGRSPRWLPAWLPAACLGVTTNGFQEHPWFVVRHGHYLGFQHVDPLCRPRSSRVYPVTTSIGLAGRMSALVDSPTPPPNPTAAKLQAAYGFCQDPLRVYVHPAPSPQVVALRSQRVLTGSGSPVSSYGGLGGGHLHFHPHTGCRHPRP